MKFRLAHVQFETIHPFLDGNGRVGRLLITLLLYHGGVLHDPLLYLSLYFRQHRNTYYDLLSTVRQTGDWEAWLAFFLEGVKLTAEAAVSTVQRLSRTFQNDRDRIESAAGRRTGSALRVHNALKSKPILSLPAAVRETKLSFHTTDAAMDLLVSEGIAKEITGKRRGRLYAYERYLAILGEGAGAP
ncbi:MAG: Fic family protein [Candidatus Aminicenantes bacterium]|nr:Fic family protein [Candidatus Aminicenantes bacterium]